MVGVSRKELRGYYFHEVQTYIPRIQSDLAVLQTRADAMESIEEMHRLFHNIKGAASQVYLRHFSAVAELAEYLLNRAMRNGNHLSAASISYLVDTTNKIKEYSSAAHPDETDERALLLERYHQFIDLEELRNDAATVSLSEQMHNLLMMDPGSPGGNIATMHRGRKPSGESGTRKALVPMVARIGLLVEGMRTQPAEAAGYRRCLEEMEAAVQQIASIVREGGVTEETVFFEDLGTMVGRAGTTEAFAAQPALVVGRLLSMLCMQTESMLLRDLAANCGEGDGGGPTVNGDLPGLLLQYIAALEGVRSRPGLIDESSAQRIAARIDRCRGLLEGSGGTAGGTGEGLATAEPEADEGCGAEPQADDFTAGAFGDDELFASEVTEDEADTLYEIFREESEEHLVAVNRSLNALEELVVEPVELSAALREQLGGMRRAVHTLKGAAAMVGFGQIAACAHGLEDLLDWLHDRADTVGPDDIRMMAGGLDLLEELSRDPEGDGSDAMADLQRRIAARIDAQGAGAVAAGADGGFDLEDMVFADESDIVPGFGESGEHAVLDPSRVERISATVDSGNIRVKVENLDEIIRIEGELVVARSSMEGLLNELQLSVDELQSAQEKLRRIAQELESGYEVQSLYGFGPETFVDDGTGGYVGGGSDFDPIELDRYSRLHLIIRSLNELAVDVNSIHAGIAETSGELNGQVVKQQLVMGAMQDKLMRTRMTPMSAVSRGFFRTVRNTAAELGKEVRLTITGDDVFMDRYIWSKMTDPIMHILRNCVDHGIESSAVRRQAGKPEVASIRIEAHQLGSFVSLRIADDGGGVDFTRLRKKLIAAGWLGQQEMRSDETLLPFLFQTGFSTRDTISQVSGRGVGLDVVQKNIQELRGTVQIESKAGQGTAFEIRIPITLSVNRAILLVAGERQYAVPLQDIVEVQRVPRAEIEKTRLLEWRNESVPVKELATLLRTGEGNQWPSTSRDHCQLVIVRGGKGFVAVMIDSVIAQREIVMKDLGSHLEHVKGISGVTILGDGSLVPVLNLSEIIEETLPTVKAPMLEAPMVAPRPAKREKPLQVLIVDDSISVRQSIARLIRQQSWKAELAVDGVDALEKLETYQPDAIILDIEMPRMNGYEFMAILRQTENLRTIPVIMLTSRDSTKHRSKADELGVDFYMTKPFQEEFFLQTLAGIRQYERPQ
ncbi:MAG: response regulator [Desulfoprunum sp.]|uniref:hybrid sensor histidine kinase/response regulator n=1 Tax=Desulfoprunum sp. TaxID=2020866 RepID=UPI003C785B89